MPNIKKENPDFIGYEYREINIDNKLVDLYLDNYPNFGWQIISAEKAQSVNSKMIIKLKRNRHIANKQELTRLQRKFEAQLSQVDKLEREKTIRASATALTIGFFGSVFLAASVMLFHDNTFLSFILGIPGLIGWVLPYWVYTNIKTRRSQELSPQINKLYDLLYDTCEQAHKLLTL